LITKRVDLNPADFLRKVLGKVSAGRTPSYEEAHALKAIERIGTGLGIGRQQLSRELGLGEGIVRTLIRRMNELGLIKVTRSGMTLTHSGLELLSEFKKFMLTAEFPKTSITVGAHNYAVLVRSAAGNVKRGIEQRDAALMSGAEGATTLVYIGGHLLMPGTEVEIDPSTESYVLEKLNPVEGDAIIIGTASSRLDAEIGAKSAALKLLEKVIPR
jgi:predicted transcriptional regulator